MTNQHRTQQPPQWLVAAAFAAIYTVWGSTYLAIRFAIDTIPPFLMAGTRFIIAGSLLYGWLRLRGVPRPQKIHWRSAIIIGGLLLLGGNGGVTWAEQRLFSSLAAVLVAMVPLWIVLLDWLRPGGKRPSLPVLVGVGLGLIGLIILVGPRELAGGTRIDLWGAGAVIAATLAWAAGSLYTHQAELPESPLMGTAQEMLAGGLLLLLAGALSGEVPRLNIAEVSLQSVLAMGYLSLFGSIVAFSAYTWLLQVTEPARVATYAYVNPVVAVLLGWALGGEDLSARTLIATAIIVGAVVLITTYRGRHS